MIGVTIDMRNENALYTVSMLAAIVEKSNKNYLDLLTPFILRCLPLAIGEKVDIEAICVKMDKDFGFRSFPRKVAEKLLERLSSDKEAPYVEKDRRKKEFRLVRLPDNAAFDAEQRAMREKIDSILQALQAFLANNHAYRDYKLDALKTALINFFENAGLTVYKRDLQELQEITDEVGTLNFYIARFVIKEFNEKSVIYERLVDVVKGFMSFKAIYYITGDQVLAQEARLRDLTVFLDCSLVIDALNYDTTADFEAIDELIKLIRSLGGKVRVFRHTLNEAANTIEAFGNQLSRANSFSLENLAAKHYTRELILSLANKLEEELLKTVAVPTVDTPDLSDASNYINLLGEAEIVEWLTKHRTVNQRDENGDIEHSQRHIYDAKSLIGVNLWRQGQHPKQIERAKAILLTQDYLLKRCIIELYPNAFRNEVPLSIIDFDLAAILWLRTNSAPTLPSDILISNASAACQPSAEIMERAIELAEQMGGNGDIPKDAVAFVGNCAEFKPYLAAAAADSKQELTESQLKTAISRFVDDLYGERLAQVEKQQQELSASRISQIETEKATLERDLSRALNEKDLEIEALQSQIKVLNERATARRKAATELAEVRSLKAKKITKSVCSVGLFLICLCIFGLFAAQAVYQIITQEGIRWINVLIAAFGAFGMIYPILAKKSLVRRAINRLGSYVQRVVYAKVLKSARDKYALNN